jgi:glycosyltransferase involved in cell wall biosynthesis
MRFVGNLPRVAIDFRWLDGLSLCNGQYRYAVDLMRGLAASRPAMQFVVLGSKPEPVSEIAGIFSDREQWEYRFLPRIHGKASVYREQALYRRLLPELHLDLFHALHSFVPLFASTPVVETVYDMMLELFPEYAGIARSREYRLHRWAFRRFVSRAIAISQATASDLNRLWDFPAEKTDVVYLSASKQPLASGRPLKGPPILLSPYNLEPRKNLPRLLDAAAKLRKSGIEFRLVLFGMAAVSEQRENEFRSRVRGLGLSNCIEFTGRVSDQRLAELYASGSVFVFPSLYEGFGLPVLEAMNCGACVIAHNDSAMCEVLGNAGWLVDMRSADAICGAISAALNSPAMGVRAAQRATMFTRERMAHQTLNVYAKVMSEALCGARVLRYSDEVYAGAGNRLLRSVAEHLGFD